jgi:hypothetical protein
MQRTGLFLFFCLVNGISLLSVQFDAVIAQTTGEQYRIETVQGLIITGEVITQTGESVVLRTRELGDVTISRSDIRSMRQIGAVQAEDVRNWFGNPQPTRYFFATNARGIQQGKWYYQNTWIFFNNVNGGVTDNFSIGVGIIPLFLFGAPATPVWLMPKVSIPVERDNIYLAAGGLFGGLIGEDALGIGLAYGVATIGSSDKNLSLGLGYGYAGSNWSRSPFVNISGIIRVGRTTYLLSENYIFSTDEDSYGLLSFGMRYATENLAVDFGLIRPTDIGGLFIALPWVGITIPIGRD